MDPVVERLKLALRFIAIVGIVTTWWGYMCGGGSGEVIYACLVAITFIAAGDLPAVWLSKKTNGTATVSKSKET